ncbi:DUF2339 domain-containing protein [Marinobacter pelagius]|uniref:DUF2339 domain-containing protein n=1 Tax=Marinobacter sp. C7 TaxID=2951363 RepID=UPI001EF03733|nr:DUF2339 domain-containing protein [Marinobacter sp. C7]MCG7198832.1 DUF2339 domain-containing protein [Marinobacter sp. C7]
MEVLLIILAMGFFLFIPVGSILGLLAFRQRSAQASRIEELERDIAHLRGEVAALRYRSESEAPVKEDRPPAPDLQPATPEKTTPEAAEVVPVAEELSDRALWQAEASVEGRPPSRLFQALKQNWMVWLGGLSVGLAGIFMVSHSISAGLIGPVQQLVLALASGLLLHGAAEFLRRRQRGVGEVFAALAGGGSITLYAALLAGVHHYGLISSTTGLVGLAGVSLGTMVMALVHGPLLAIMGLSGAYLVPILIGGEDGSVAFVLSYSFLVTLSSLLLMRFVFRDWLWYATLAGALLWWLMTSSAAPAGVSTACYLAGLLLAFAILPGKVQQDASRIRQAFLPLLALWAISLASQPADTPFFWAWLLIVPLAALIPQSRGALWFVPWGAVLASAAGWLVYMSRTSDDTVFLVQFPAGQRAGFVTYLIAAAILTVAPALWQWVRNPGQRRWVSLMLLAPLVWLTLGWLLLHGYERTSVWATGTLILGGLYGVLAWQMERLERYRTGVVWAVLAAHISYSLAAVMMFREASLTLALAAQFVTLTWLARRFQMPELYVLLKLALALVVARLTFNPWLQGYDASVHWSLWTYGGATVAPAVASRIADKNHGIRPWLEAATLHLLVLFLGTELRYWLYDGDIFAREYSLSEATINTLLWGALSLTYLYRARASESLAWLYRLFSRVLLGLSCLSYLAIISVHNPWLGKSVIAATPVFNMLLPAYGGPVLLALVVSRVAGLGPRAVARWFAAGSFLLFTALEIRQLWRGSDMALTSGVSEGELYTYSVVGMLYAIAAILWSGVNHSVRLYKAGMALLGLVIGKIFLIDMAGLQGFWRVAAFMGLGLALLGLAWMYRRTHRTPEPE